MVLRLTLAVLLVASSAWAQTATAIGPTHIICDSGCTAGAAGLTNTELRATPLPVSGTVAFSNTTLAVTNAGTFATQATLAAETTKVIGTVNIAAAQSIAVTGTFYQATQPVSGTFWQATQPVSGTFWQATQPVSGTFYQATQPVSIASMPSTPVTGTFWQATQPVSFTQPALVAGSALIGKVGIDQTTPGTTNRVDIGVFPDNEPFNVAQINGVTASMGVGASNTGTLRVAGLIQDGTDVALVTSDGVLQAAPAVSNIVALSINESAAAPVAAVWYLKREWALPASAHAVPMRAFATVTTAAGSRTMIGVMNSLGTLNVGTNAFAAVNSVASPLFYGRLFGCVTTVLSATLDTLTVTYTDELGVSSTSAAVAFAASAPVGNCYEFALGGSDVGARAITNITDTAATTGIVTVYGVTSLFESLGTTTTDFTTVDSGELKASEELGIMFIQAATTAQQRTAGLTVSLR